MTFDPRKILVIDFGQLGDVVMSLPSLRAIRERFTRAHVTVAVGKTAGEIVGMRAEDRGAAGVDARCDLIAGSQYRERPRPETRIHRQ